MDGFGHFFTYKRIAVGRENLIETHGRIHNVHIVKAGGELPYLRVFKAGVTENSSDIGEQLSDKVKQHSRVLSAGERYADVPFIVRVPLDDSRLGDLNLPV